RWFLVWGTQLVFYGTAWLQWNDRQAVLFELASRRFYIFGFVLYPQDFIYLTALLLISAYALFLFTAVAGRLWCGYACPQTVYTEIFLWIERRFEGERGARMKLDAGPWTLNKLWRKGGKHVVWVLLGLWTGFTFVGYFTPIHSLWAEAFTLDFGPWEWFWVNFYGLATYGNAGFLREQVCQYMCPYARFQSAMFDKDTLIVSYDSARGDPRGTRARGTDLASAGLGQCIDCSLCVQVCPAGIDIREGLQSECIACTACIDACDGVMDKMHYPRGLIRYATQNALALQGPHPDLSRRPPPALDLRRLLRPRVLIYGAVLILIAGAFVTSLGMRRALKVDVVRDRMTLARIVDDGLVENLYRLQLMNATEQARRYHLAVQGIAGAALAGQGEVALQPAEARWVTVAVRVPPEQAAALKPGAHAIRFEISPLDAAGAAVVEKSTFVIPR
ncbi:cytochrome c oxidase accessory protein CcoG, partial [Ideonella sp.]|uniref:cytochrome c oxidase accessory protein CcoG n=1 Tax=Ideonella sp. TaxID=1929293 RepID=UPI00351B777C